jgi:hypothetical protein
LLPEIRAHEEMNTMECPLCRGRGSCFECDGVGSVTCDACDGLGDGCYQCEFSGLFTCLPCDRTGLCFRCRGVGRIELDDGVPFSASF